MKTIHTRRTGKGWLVVFLYMALFALILGGMLGCEEAGAGGGSGGEETTADDGDSGDDGTTTDGDSGDDDSSTLDTSDMVLHLGFDNSLSDETGNTSDRIAYLPADSSPTEEDYGEGRHGDANGSVVFYATGDTNKRYSVEVKNMNWSNANSITVMAWVFDDLGVATGRRDIASFDTGDSDAFVLGNNDRAINDEETARIFEAVVQGEKLNPFPSAYSPGSWVHVAMVYDHDATELRVYQDSDIFTLKDSTPATVTLDVDSDGALIIGGDSTGNLFSGRIDDFAIFTRALSDAEIALAKDQIGTN